MGEFDNEHLCNARSQDDQHRTRYLHVSQELAIVALCSEHLTLVESTHLCLLTIMHKIGGSSHLIKQSFSKRVRFDYFKEVGL